MKDHIKTIDNMDISDSEKRNIHEQTDKNKRNYLTLVGNMLMEYTNLQNMYQIEHTHKGLNLRVISEDIQTTKEIKAIAEYNGLNLVQDERRNIHFWLRFTVE